MGTKYICRSIMSRDIIRCSKLRLLIITLWREGAILSGGSEQVTRHLPEVSYILFRVSLRGRQCAIRNSLAIVNQLPNPFTSPSRRTDDENCHALAIAAKCSSHLGFGLGHPEIRRWASEPFSRRMLRQRGSAASYSEPRPTGREQLAYREQPDFLGRQYKLSLAATQRGLNKTSEFHRPGYPLHP